MQVIGPFIPLTPALDSMRLALLEGFSLAVLASLMTKLGLFAVLPLALGLATFEWAVEVAMRSGSLTRYLAAAFSLATACANARHRCSKDFADTLRT